MTRKTPLQLLLLRHGTIGQAEFYLRSRGEDISDYRRTHARFEAALHAVIESLPPEQRRTRVERDQLDRFQFAEDDIVLIVGQDGLVPNTAKYLTGQLTIGINPDPASYDGVLCRHAPKNARALLDWLRTRDRPEYDVQRRTMLAAQREDGQRILALNEVFIGHQSHQSARYRIRVEGREERQSSSGVLCATGTGCTGWTLSIARQRKLQDELPRPEDDRAVWLVREPFPSVSTQVSLDFGGLSRSAGLEIASEMAEGGVVFADGIESDRLEFADGHRLVVRLAEQKLALVVRAGEKQIAPRAPATPIRTVRRRPAPRGSAPHP
ncbi:MAG TPA: hypothetical protein VMR31_12545 [Myxococcota bacterium]|nr:hypothetical protein [Myxococcota bacterium]